MGAYTVSGPITGQGTAKTTLGEHETLPIIVIKKTHDIMLPLLPQHTIVQSNIHVLFTDDEHIRTVGEIKESEKRILLTSRQGDL